MRAPTPLCPRIKLGDLSVAFEACLCFPALLSTLPLPLQEAL